MGWTVAAVVVVLFFVSCPLSPGEDTLAKDQLVSVPSRDELREENLRLRRELEQCAASIRVLTENLAIARTESELFQRRWTEARLRAQTLGMDLADADLTNLQRQVIESVRSLYVVEAERRRLATQLEALIAAIEANGDLTGAVSRAQQVLATSAGLLEAASGDAASLQSARIADVNETLRVVVLNVGSEQGARVGMPFVVFHGDRVVAELRVIEVRRQICGALIESQDAVALVKAGDEVRVSKN